MSKVLILAPHVDDEVIGCWSVLNNSKMSVQVLYLKELTRERVREACVASEGFNFSPWFDNDNGVTVNLIESMLASGSFDEVYVPSRRDWHADHQAVNRKYRKYATKFYSVDMARGVKLEDSESKRQALDEFYPSQRNLWANNDKYWLFEDISDLDYDEYRTLGWTQPSGFVLEVTVEAQFTEWVMNEWYPAARVTAGQFDKEAIDALLSHCSGRVIIKDKLGIKEAL